MIIEGVTATRCFSPFFIISRKTQKTHIIWQFSNFVDFSCINEQDIFENSKFRRFCNDSTALSDKNDFFDFVSATRDLSPNFIKLKNSIQKVYNSRSILIYCMIMCGKLISCEYNSENQDTTADLSKFHIFA